MFLALHSMGSMSLGSLVLLGHLTVLLTTALTVSCWLCIFMGGVVSVVDFSGPLLDFIDETVVWYLDSVLGLGLSCAWGFEGLGLWWLGLCVENYWLWWFFSTVHWGGGVISHYKKIGCNIGLLPQTACLVVHLVAVSGFAFLFGCAPVGQALASLAVLAWGLSVRGGLVLWLLTGPPGFAWWISFAPVFSFVYCWVLIFVLSPFYIF